MSSFLVTIFFILNLAIVLQGLLRKFPMGVFRFPVLIALVNLTFIYPQLIDIVALYPDGYLMLSISFMIACTFALWVGFTIAEKKTKPLKTITEFYPSKLLTYALAFLFVGTVAYFMNRGVYKGGKVSGTYVIINFFTGFINYSLILIMMGLYLPRQNKHQIFIIIFSIICLIQLDQFAMLARRANAAYFILIIAYFYALHSSKYRYRLVSLAIPAIALGAMAFNTIIGEYRTNAYNGETNTIDNIQSINFDNSQKAMTKRTKTEVTNAIYGINLTYAIGEYDFGASNWNGIIGNFLPKGLLGAETKENLMYHDKKQPLVSKLTGSGLTMTGYYDSFSSFGLFGFIKFMIIGWVMGFLWKRRNQSQLYIFLYLMLLTPGLHLITHSSNFFVSNILLYFVFIYPFLSHISYQKEIDTNIEQTCSN